MSSEDRVSELLLVWEERAERGQPVTPQELCQDYPDLLPELAQRIKTLQALRPMVDVTVLQSSTPGRTPTTVDGGAPTPSNPVSSRYQPLRFHAAGGLGEVFVAQDEELHREVALKRMKARATQDAESCRRFLMEAEVTARLEHPGVVPVYGLGQDGEGRPFYAMRFIQGETLQEAVRCFHEANKAGRDPGERTLAFRQLLGRFVAICNTMAYAHSRKIVHRDLKPANIMLGKYGETLVVDWGLARPFTCTEDEDGGAEVTLTPSTDSAEGTALGQALGTPAYMSPEQAEGRWDVIGPASDIYSLGATLYVLLTGQGAFEGRSVGEVLDRVKRGDFPTPRQRKADVPRTLEAVCLKAMALRPEDRYGSALDLAADLEHWLADEPVMAYREPVTARLRRWGRRHRTVVTAATVLLVTAVAALTGGMILLEHKQTEVLKERNAAHDSRDQAQAVAKFYEDHVLDAPRPKGVHGGMGKGVKLKAALDQAAPKIDKAFASQPELEAAVRNTLGMTYWYLGQFESANPHLEKAYALRLKWLGLDHPDTLTSLHDLARQRWRQGKHEEGIRLCRQALESRRRVLGSEHQDTLWSQLFLGLFLLEKNRFLLDKTQLDEAEAVLRQAIESCKRTLGVNHVQTLHGQNDLALVLKYKGKQEESLALDLQTLEGRRRSLIPDHPDTLLSMANLASALWDVGRLEEAEALYRESLEGRRRVLGDNHKDTWVCLDNLASLLKAQGKLAEIEDLHRQRLKSCQQLRSPDDPEILRSLMDLGAFLGNHGKREEAGKLLRQAVEASRRKLGHDHPSTLIRQNQLAWLLEKQRKAKEAVELYRQTLEGQSRVRGSKHEDTLITQINLIVLLAHEGKKTEAKALHRDMLEGRRRVPGPDVPQIPFGGDWRGNWKNSVGETGEERLSLEEKADGTITGVYSWSKISIRVRGDRISRNTVVLQGATQGRFYRIVGAVDDGKLLLQYSASRLNVGGAYYGRSMLTKSK